MQYKNIRIRKAGGGTRLQRVQVLASGKYKFVKNNTKKSRSTAPTTRKKAVKRGSYTMARRRKRVSRRSGKMGGVTGLMLGGAGYGIVREPINQLVSNVPLIGGLGDEVVMLIASYLMATKTSGVLRKVGRAGIVIEAHNLSRNLMGGVINFGGGSGGVTTSAEQSFR